MNPRCCSPLWSGPGKPPVHTCRKQFGRPAGVTAGGAR